MSQVLLGNVIMNNNKKIKETLKNLLLVFMRRKYFKTNNEDKIEKLMGEIKTNGKTYLKVII